jgi:hypothetical protein
MAFSLSCNSGGAWKIESATFFGRRLLLATQRRPSFPSFKSQSMNIEHGRRPGGIFAGSGATT